ncbi:MAG: GNAT family N-acetyltransferase [Acidobacteria bacterium]|nr:GNAT family N-acetyltransferase [Acidobacteriota bacterium]
MSHLEIDVSAPARPQLRQFLTTWPFKPHRWGVTGSTDGLDDLVVGRVQRGVEDAGAVTWSAMSDGRLAGFATLLPLEWDSRVLAMPAARVELLVNGSYGESRDAADALLAAATRDAGRRGLRHVSIRVDAADDAVIHALESSAFLNVDALITFFATLAELPAGLPVGSFELRAATAADVDRIVELAAWAFRDGRFHTDPSVPAERARDVYRAWAAACCEGSAADTTIVAADGNEPVGFIACRILADTAVHLRRPTGTIPLIASSQTVRGRGVGRALIAAAAQWFGRQEAAAVEVGTQLRNVAAARLYERSGFRLAAGSLSFRRVIEP